MADLPDCDDAFLRFFDPWCSDSDREQRVVPGTRPDLLEIQEARHCVADELCCLDIETRDLVRRHLKDMLEAAEEDWTEQLGVSPPVSLGWVEVADEYYDRAMVSDLVARSDPADFANDYLVETCEFGAVVAEVFRELLPRLVWIVDWPYWESALFDPQTGSVIPPFHWGIKKMSDDGIDDGYAAKIRRCVEFLEHGS